MNGETQFEYTEPKALMQFVKERLESGAVKIDFEKVKFSSAILWEVFYIALDEKVKHISFEGCHIDNHIELSGMSKGISISISNCTINENTIISVKESVATVFYYTENEIRSEGGEGALPLINMEEVFLDNVIIENNSDIKIKSSYIFKKLRFSGVNSINVGSFLQIDDTKFGNAEILINKKVDLFEIKGCEKLEIEGHSSYLNFIFSGSIIKKFNISNSNLDSAVFDLDYVPIQSVEIDNSDVGKSMRIRCSPSKRDDGSETVSLIEFIDSSVGKLLLDGRTISNVANFSGTTFTSSPSFHNSSLPQGCYFPDKKNFLSRRSGVDVLAYRTLRYAMESQRNRESEGTFFALEQEAITNVSSNLPKAFKVGFWYGLLSDYGTNYNKSLLLLLFSIIIFGFLYAIISSPVIGIRYQIDFNLIGNSVIYSVKQVISPFSGFKEIEPFSGDQDSRVLLGLVSWVESVISVILLTLSIISVRWQFKRG